MQYYNRYRWCAASTGVVVWKTSSDTSSADYYFYGAVLLAGSRHINLHLGGLPTAAMRCIDDY